MFVEAGSTPPRPTKQKKEVLVTQKITVRCDKCNKVVRKGQVHVSVEAWLSKPHSEDDGFDLDFHEDCIDVAKLRKLLV